MTTYLLITSDKPKELTASTDRKNWLPVVNAEVLPECVRAITDKYDVLISGKVKLDTPVELEGWEVEVVMSDGWQPTYNNPDNSGLEQPSEPIAYRLKRSEPVKQRACREICGDAACIHEGCAFTRNESPIEAKTQVFSHKEVKSMLRSMSLSEIRELEKKAELIIDSHSDKELDEMTEHYLVAMVIKYAQVESHKTQESQTDEQYNLPAAAVFQIQMIALADDEMVKRPGAA